MPKTKKKPPQPNLRSLILYFKSKILIACNFCAAILFRTLLAGCLTPSFVSTTVHRVFCCLCFQFFFSILLLLWIWKCLDAIGDKELHRIISLHLPARCLLLFSVFAPLDLFEITRSTRYNNTCRENRTPPKNPIILFVWMYMYFCVCLDFKTTIELIVFDNYSSSKNPPNFPFHKREQLFRWIWESRLVCIYTRKLIRKYF